VLAEVDGEGALKLAGAADSRLARGLVALLVRGLRGEHVSVLRRLSVRELAETADLPSLMTRGRLNGMDAMLRVMEAQLACRDAEAADAVGATDVVHDDDGAQGEGREVQPSPREAPTNPHLAWPAADEEVALLLSGGVDSSVALHELLAAGHRVRAFYLRIWLESEQEHAARGECPWEEDWAYCRAVCEQAGVPLEAVSLQREYQDSVVGYLVAEAAAGRTPNPDIMCNSRIKFGVFHERIGRHFAHVASGHYAQTTLVTEMGSNDIRAPRAQLLRSADSHKDQTYFLSQLRQDQLRNTLFPIGYMRKDEVRAAAQRLGLPNRARKDSQGICFLGQLNYDEFLRDHLGERAGPIIEHETGEPIGTHRGLWFHTVGQRRGLGPALDNANRARGPWHVVRKDIGANVLYATRHYSAADKARDQFRTAAINWVAGEPPSARDDGPLHLHVKVRHGESSHKASVTLESGGRAHVVLADRDKGLAPGQFAAFYDGDVCLGGGVITEGAV
jgi:tRNA (5-methylaminomethyl-2-thiouridylate)-methyltransferase